MTVSAASIYVNGGNCYELPGKYIQTKEQTVSSPVIEVYLAFYMDGL